MLSNPTSQGATADRCFATLAVVQKFGPIWIILENSDELVKDEVADWSRIVTALADRGYKVVTCCLDTVEFGLPCHRGRAYFIALRSMHPGHDIKDLAAFSRAVDQTHRQHAEDPPVMPGPALLA